MFSKVTFIVLKNVRKLLVAICFRKIQIFRRHLLFLVYNSEKNGSKNLKCSHNTYFFYIHVIYIKYSRINNFLSVIIPSFSMNRFIEKNYLSLHSNPIYPPSSILPKRSAFTHYIIGFFEECFIFYSTNSELLSENTNLLMSLKSQNKYFNFRFYI